MYKLEMQNKVQGKWVATTVTPIYGEDINLAVERESGERLCRYNIDGTLTFHGADFKWASESPYPHRLNLYDVNPIGLRTLIATAPFSREDMEFDYDNKIATIQLEGKDRYTDFLEKINAEYDLVQLAPPRRTVGLFKRAFLQLYVLGDTKLTNVFANTEYETNATSGAENKNYGEIESLGFSLLRSNIVFKVTIDKEDLAEFGIIGGVYHGDTNEGIIWNVNGETNLKYSTSFNVWRFYDKNGNSLKAGLDAIPTNTAFHIGIYMTQTPQYTCGGMDGWNKDVYGRLIHDNGDIPGASTLPTNDIWEHSMNYKYYKNLRDDVPLWTRVANSVKISTKTTDIPNKWMRNDEGKYFIPPQPLWKRDRIIAIGWHQWIPESIWFNNSVELDDLTNKYDESYKLKDAYLLQDAIRVLLQKIDPKISLYSDFLDGIDMQSHYENPISGTAYYSLFITPVTNIKKTQYEQAAQKGKISLKQILDMLKNCFGCYWFLQHRTGEDWQLRIEHALWFKNGGSYDTAQNPIADLTQEKTNLSNKPWITQQNRMTYDLSDVKSRYEFEWADKSTRLFNGDPIICSDTYCEGQPVEKVHISNFIADIDLIESSPESVGDDLYVVIGTGDSVDDTVLYENTIGYDYDKQSHPIFKAQNNSLSFLSLAQTFLNYEKPSNCELEAEPVYDEQGDKIDVNVPMVINSPQRIVKQTVKAPFMIKSEDISPEKIETGNTIALKQGLGQIEKISMNLFTQSAEIELLFEPKQ